MITLRAAIATDQAFLTSRPGSLSQEVIAKQIRDGRLQIIELDGMPIGVIKSYVLWETLPFMEVIILDPEMRGLGYGTRAVRLWEENLARGGFDLAIVSTEKATANEFWRKVGYSDCGMLAVRGKPEEIFMQRTLVPPKG